MRSIRWMLKTDPQQRPKVEDLLNIPGISMRLREKTLQKNFVVIKKKEEEIKKKEDILKQKEEELRAREESLKEKEREIEELERQL